jgi:uncharacterized protein
MSGRTEPERDAVRLASACADLKRLQRARNTATAEIRRTAGTTGAVCRLTPEQWLSKSRHRRCSVASNRDNQGSGQSRGGSSTSGGSGGSSGGGGGQSGGGSSDRGFAGMSDEQQREIARQGGEASARQQERDDQGQFAGTGSDSGKDGSRSQGGGSGGSKSGGSSR